MEDQKNHPIKRFFITVIGYIVMGFGFLMMAAIVLGMLLVALHVFFGITYPFSAFLFPSQGR